MTEPDPLSTSPTPPMPGEPTPVPPAEPSDGDLTLHRPEDAPLPIAFTAPVPAPRRTLTVRLGRGWWIAGVIVLAMLIAGAWLLTTRLPRLLRAPADAGVVAADGSAAVEARRIQAKLFYPAPNGLELVPVSREVLYGATPTEQIRRIVEAQVQAPPNGYRSAIPAGTTVRTVFLTSRGDAYVDLGGTIASGHSGGSLNEALTVYAIVNAVTVNLPDVSAVQILVEGKEVDTLAGHLDLRHPLGKTLDWVRKGQ